MKILDMLGLGKKKEGDKRAPSPADRNGRDKIPAAAQNMCCGSCGGQGHAEKKEQAR